VLIFLFNWAQKIARYYITLSNLIILFFSRLSKNQNSNKKNQFKKKYFKDFDDEFDSFFEDGRGNNMRFFGFPPEILEQMEKIMSSLENFEGEIVSLFF
jgi:hypothetical protein